MNYHINVILGDLTRSTKFNISVFSVSYMYSDEVRRYQINLHANVDFSVLCNGDYSIQSFSRMLY